jgi:hypothetical protein
MAEVSDMGEIFLTQRANIRTFPLDFAFSGSEKPAQDSEQTGLAATVWSGELDVCSGRHRQIEFAKKPAISAHAAKPADL